MKIAQLGSFHFIDEVLGYYDAGPHQRLTTSRSKIYDAHDIIFERAAHIPRSKRDMRYVKALHHYVRSELALMFGDRKRAIREIMASIATRPIEIILRRSVSLFKQAISGG